MPKIRFASLPRPVWEHLLARVSERQVSLADLHRLQDWVKSQPQFPDGDWYKDFGSFILMGDWFCGSGELPKMILTKGMKPFGDPIFIGPGQITFRAAAHARVLC